MTAAFDLDPETWQGYRPQTNNSATGLPFMTPNRSIPGAGDDAIALAQASRPQERAIEAPPKDAPLWLDDVYSLVARGRPDEAADILFDHVDDLLLEGKLARCDALLRAIDLGRLDTNLIVGVLSITLAAAEELPYRARLLKRAKERLSAIAPDRVERLLSGLR